MFTSRAEYRLSLREDNADWRLTELGYQLGCVDEERYRKLMEKRETVSRETSRLAHQFLRPSHMNAAVESRLGFALDQEHTLLDLLRRPEVSYASLMASAQLAGLPGPASALDAAAAEQVEIQTKYAGYIERQRVEVERHRHYDSMALPHDLDYAQVQGLSFEARQKLTLQRPETLGQAGRISGVTPATISLLLVYLKKTSRVRRAEAA